MTPFLERSFAIVRLHLLREALVVAGIGMALGVPAAVVVSRPLATFLVDGLSARDPVAYALTMATLGIVALAAGWIPAWRAARIDPMAVLRRD
jgi:putative ABC transport system permease protein